MTNQIPVKPINEIEVKSEVSENDKILILDSESEEARLASKDELKGEQGEPGPQGEPGEQGEPGPQGDPGTDAWEYMTQAQYDALTPEQKMDGISRAIYDAAQHAFRTLLRLSDNVLHYNDQDELYADLQFENGLTPTSAFPAGVSIGNVSSTDGWDQSGLLINAKTNLGDYLRRLYGNDGKLYYDGGTGVFKEIFTSDGISDIIEALRNELSEVAFSGKSSDLDNDAGFNSCPVMTQQQYDEQTGTASDDKRYFIYEEY